MKKLLLFLLITFCVNTVKAQFELKGYLQTSFSDEDSPFFQEQVTNIKPTMSLAYNHKNKNFQQLTLLNFFSGEEANIKGTGLEFSYSYNFALWRKSEKWLPFIGPEIVMNPQRYSITTIGFNSSTATIVRSDARELLGALNVTFGVQYKILDNVRLELASALNFYNYEFYTVTQEESNGKVTSFSDNGIELQETMDVLKSMPINLGILVRFGSR